MNYDQAPPFMTNSDISPCIFTVFSLKANYKFQIHRSNMQATQMIYFITEIVLACHNRECKAT